MLKLIWWVVIGLFRSRASLEVEIVALRHQLNVLRRKSPKRLAFNNFDRLIFANLYRIAPRITNALAIVEPATIIRWYRAGFRLLWRWKSRSRGGGPKVSLVIRQLIRDMSLTNPLWARLGSMAIFSNLESPLAKPRSPNRWQGTGDLHPKPGRPSSATTPMGSHRLICLSFRHSHFGCSMACCFSITADAKSYGWA
ncbi:hypothetical protein QEV83_03250 [Methylocapsa sp. D3K7]|uniref:hypothetical protein n=1 Tax=Methylocapsa sp. D3K7 TaxID=3041435 RepID=UPI00244E6CDE|nr:hypothetical protein [Methylocapsa sp. D3K7]WGJ15316.1 hypothetical protein QEV83_03250 [Methylocapsa sp. D3K7]